MQRLPAIISVQGGGWVVTRVETGGIEIVMWEIYRKVVLNTRTAIQKGSEFEDERPDECMNLRIEYDALIQENAHKQRLEVKTKVVLYLKNYRDINILTSVPMKTIHRFRGT